LVFGLVGKEPEALLERREIEHVTFEAAPVEESHDDAVHLVLGNRQRRHGTPCEKYKVIVHGLQR